LLGSISGDDTCEEAIMIRPPLELLLSACHQGDRKGKTPRVSPACAGMEDLHHSQSQEAQQRNYPSDITWVHPKARSYFLVNMTLSPYHEYKLHMAPHFTPAGFTGLAADYITFPFSGSPSAPLYPACVTNLNGWQWSAGLFEVCRSVRELRLGF
jgi:hypothetical protein